MIRYRPNDVLSIMLLELCVAALALPLADGDRRESWRLACQQLLDAVPCPAQRLAWRMELAHHLFAGSGVPVQMGMGYLTEEAA